MSPMQNKEAIWLLKEKYAGVESPEYSEDLKQLEAGVPLAYLIGHVPFLGTTIYLDSKPLIPRAETEYWVEKAIDEIRDSEVVADSLRILDLCAGSGAIGIAVLRHIPQSTIDFAEIDRAHHLTILKNISENRIDQNRAKILGGDLFEHADGLYDYIFSNPPYINPLRREHVEESVLANEPHQALFGGADGMELITRIIEESPDFLKRGGTLYLEHEPEQAEIILHQAKMRGYAEITAHKDQYEAIRMTSMTPEQ